MKKYIMALDQGTTSSRCILFDKQGNVCSMAQKEFPQIYPNPGWVEHNPMEIWSSQLSVATEAISKIGASGEDIAALVRRGQCCLTFTVYAGMRSFWNISGFQGRCCPR